MLERRATTLNLYIKVNSNNIINITTNRQANKHTKKLVETNPPAKYNTKYNINLIQIKYNKYINNDKTNHKTRLKAKAKKSNSRQ